MHQLSKDAEFRDRILKLICEHGRENGYKALKGLRLKWDKNNAIDTITMEWHWFKQAKKSH